MLPAQNPRTPCLTRIYAVRVTAVAVEGLSKKGNAIPPSRQAEAPPFTQRRLQTDEILTATSSLRMTIDNVIARKAIWLTVAISTA